MNSAPSLNSHQSGFSAALVASALFLGGCNLPMPETVLVTPETLRAQPRLLKPSSLITLEMVGKIDLAQVQPVGRGKTLITFSVRGDTKEQVNAFFLTENASTVARAQKGDFNGFGKITGVFLTGDPLTIDIKDSNGGPNIVLNREPPPAQ